jgi:hypothetical protein
LGAQGIEGSQQQGRQRENTWVDEAKFTKHEKRLVAHKRILKKNSILKQDNSKSAERSPGSSECCCFMASSNEFDRPTDIVFSVSVAVSSPMAA